MPKIGKTLRAYPLVQAIITEYINNNIAPTTDLIQKAFYRENYRRDSRVQRKTIYDCIIRGRDNVINMWDSYLEQQGEGGFLFDLSKVEHYEQTECEKQVESLDFTDFHDNLLLGRFGKDTEIIIREIGDYPAVAVLFERKLREYSRLGANFLIADYGSQSTWFMPSYWRWNVREFGLYRRTLQIFRKQLKRGRRTKVLLPSAISIPKVLEYETVLRAALEDGTAWICEKCKARNVSASEICAICKTPKVQA